MTNADPIAFTAPMARAILGGRKTQTRRACISKLYTEVPTVIPRGYRLYAANKSGAVFWRQRHQAGSRMWVREAWCAPKIFDQVAPLDIPPGTAIRYMATPGDHSTLPSWGRYRNPRYMCRWMARIVLEVTLSRAEHLQDISEDDARAEGVERDFAAAREHEYRSGFMMYWDKINQVRHSWAANPLVEVITFRRLLE